MNLKTMVLCMLFAVSCNSSVGMTVHDGNEPLIEGCTTEVQGDAVLYVDSAGDDDNDCTGTGMEACATVQGALDKLGKDVAGNVMVYVAAGDYGCYSVSGFRFDPQAQSVYENGAYPGGPVPGGASISLQGTMTTSTLTSGDPTGTVTSSSAGSVTGLGLVLTKMTDSNQSWTTDDLKGRYLVYTSGPRTYSRYLIYKNTATEITFANATTSLPSAGNGYRIEEPATNINTACPRAPTAGVGGDGGYTIGLANLAAIFISDNLGASVGTVKISQMNLTNTSGFGIWQRSLNGTVVDTVRARQTSNTSHRLLFEQATDYVTVRNVTTKATDSSSSGVYGIGTEYNPIQLGGFGLQVSNSMCEGGRTCVASPSPAYVNVVVADPVSNFGLELRGDSLVLGYRCEGSNPGPFTACIRAGDSEHRGYCKGGMYLNAMTINAQSAGTGVSILGQCVTDIKGTTGFMDAGVGLGVGLGGIVNIYDPNTNLSGRVADVEILDSFSFGGSSHSYYSLSAIRALGPPTCTPVSGPYSSAVCCL